jgi:hypothetical protein
MNGARGLHVGLCVAPIYSALLSGRESINEGVLDKEDTSSVDQFNGKRLCLIDFYRLMNTQE